MLNSYTYNRKTIAAAIEWMKSGKGEPPPFVKKNPGVFVNRKGTLYTKDGRRVIADEDTVPTMRELMFGKDSAAPHGRDSLFHFASRAFVGLTRREIARFISRQRIQQSVRAMPPAQDKGGYRHKKFGTAEFDLVHVRGKDLPGWFKAGSADRYFLTVTETMTAYFGVEFVKNKFPSVVAPAMATILDRFKGVGINVHTVRSDAGGEFQAETKTMLESRDIKQRVTTLAALVENRNRVFQRYFYTLVRSKRGLGFMGSMRKAEEIMNNLQNRTTGLSPTEAVAEGQKAVRTHRDAIRKGRAAYTRSKQPRKPLEVGVTVRKLAIRRKDRAVGYKSYRAEQWSEETYTITQRAKQGVAWKYKLSSGEWQWQDQLQVVGSPDLATDNLLSGRRNKGADDEVFYDKQDELYDPEEEAEPAPKRAKKKVKPRAKKKPRAKPKPKPKPEAVPGRRSSRRRKRVDYAALESKYDYL